MDIVQMICPDSRVTFQNITASTVGQKRIDKEKP